MLATADWHCEACLKNGTVTVTSEMTRETIVALAERNHGMKVPGCLHPRIKV
jgi:hypothetical protein